MNVFLSEDCGNSPKNILLGQLTVAIAKCDTQFIHSKTSDDICWNIVGDQVIQGKAELIREIERLKQESIKELTVEHVISHGRAGAVNGTMTKANGQRIAFCDYYEFASAKGASVHSITSYRIFIG